MAKKRGFTLIELIAVVAILAILAAVAVPRVIAYVDKSKKTAIKTSCKIMVDATAAAYNDGKLSELIEKEKEILHKRNTNNTKYTDWQAVGYINTNELMNYLEKEKILSPDKNLEVIRHGLYEFRLVEAFSEAPIDMIKLDGHGHITEESRDDVFRKWMETNK